MINILIVDDSPIARRFLTEILNREADLNVITALASGSAAVKWCAANEADIILMDIHMPGISGLDATRRIMNKTPQPIIVMSSLEDPELDATRTASTEAGAAAFAAKPVDVSDPHYESHVDQPIKRIRMVHSLSAVRKLTQTIKAPSIVKATISPVGRVRLPKEVALVAIGSSLGGPVALAELLAELSPDIRVPIVISQHITKGFLVRLVERLNDGCVIPIKAAADGEILRAGTVYFAPDDRYLSISRGLKVSLYRNPPPFAVGEMVTQMFDSVRESFGKRAVGILLTGMGTDGSVALKALKDVGAITLAQDGESAVVHGMAGEAIKIGGVTHVLPPKGIGQALTRELGS
jgi:two-component system, chemotaxis family, protein-glutamate methylesterase/glutaminase